MSPSWPSPRLPSAPGLTEPRSSRVSWVAAPPQPCVAPSCYTPGALKDGTHPLPAPAVRLDRAKRKIDEGFTGNQTSVSRRGGAEGLSESGQRQTLVAGSAGPDV